MFATLKTLLHEVNVNDDTDYYQLYTMIELLDIAVGAEGLQPEEKVCADWLIIKFWCCDNRLYDHKLGEKYTKKSSKFYQFLSLS